MASRILGESEVVSDRVPFTTPEDFFAKDQFVKRLEAGVARVPEGGGMAMPVAGAFSLHRRLSLHHRLTPVGSG